MFEVVAAGNLRYRSRSAVSVARVAAEWRSQGHRPRAYALQAGAAAVEVPVTGVAETTAALKAAL